MSLETVDARHPGPSGLLPPSLRGCLVALAGLVAAVVILRAAPGAAPSIIVAVATGVLAAWIAWQDFKTFTIPDSAVLALALVATAWRWSDAAWFGDALLPSALTIGLDAALPAGALLAFRELYFRRRGHDGIGFGDVKLAAAGGLLVGTVGFSWALFGASLAGLLVVGATRLSPKSRGKPFASSDKLAFGAILAPAVWVVWIVQQTPLLATALG